MDMGADTTSSQPLPVDRSLVHRRVVRIGAAAAWLVTILLLIGALLNGDERLYLEAIAPALAAALMTAQILLKAENGVIALFGSAMAVIVMYSAIGTPTSTLPAAIALVVICGVGTLLVTDHRLAVTGVLGVLLFATPQLWGFALDEALQLGLAMSLGFLATATVLINLLDAAVITDARFEALFESSPSAILEEDWSDSLEYIRSEYAGRPDRILPFLLAYPQVVRRAVSRARVLRVNQAALDMLDATSPEEILGRRDGTKVADESLEAFAVALAGLYEGKASLSHELPAVTLKGRRIWLQVRVASSAGRPPGAPVLVGLSDVTNIKNRQDAMADLVRAKDEFIARVSHEIRTPLTAVLGLTTEMTSMDRMSDSERAELMHLVADQAVEMSYLVEDLLVASRAEIGRVAIDTRLVDLEVEFRAAVDAVGVGAVELPAPIPHAIADPARVRQILRNLLTNAQRYGGPVVRVAAGSYYDKVWLEIRDDGEGVPETLARGIFEPYGTAHHGVEGSVGLGLSVSRQLSELMGGSLGYRRDRGESVFRLELPLAATPEESALASHMADV